MIKLAIIEDDPGTRAGLEKMIGAYPDLLCLVSAGSVEEFWAKLPSRSNVQILLIDIDLPGQSGLDALPTLRKRFPEAELIIFTHSEDRIDLLKAVHLGATGYLLKDFPLETFRKHIDTILDGGAPMSSKMARKLVEYLNPPKRKGSEQHPLSAKEEQVIRLLADGNTYEEAAALINTSVNGVKYHIKNIYRKLQVDNRLDAIRIWKGE